MEVSLTFVRLFLYAISMASPLLIALLLIITVLGLFVGSRERWTKYDSVYWAFITATTVGYGDIRPAEKISKALAVIIAIIGMIFTGIVVALALHSASFAFKQHTDLMQVRTHIEQIKQQ